MMVNPPEQKITAVLLDLDDTLYDAPAMKDNVAKNIQQYMVSRLGVPEGEVEELCFKCYMEYGTTMAGLVAQGYTIDADDWHAAVHHTLPYRQYLSRDPELRLLLRSIPLPLHIFTNADRKHAATCLDILGVSDCFQSVVTYEDVQEAATDKGWVRHGCPIVCKPAHQSYLLALEATGLDPTRTVWFDDSARNIAAGRKLGMYCVLVGRTGVEGVGAHAQLADIHDLPSALPWLLEGGEAVEVGASSPLCGAEAVTVCSS